MDEDRQPDITKDDLRVARAAWVDAMDNGKPAQQVLELLDDYAELAVESARVVYR